MLLNGYQVSINEGIETNEGYVKLKNETFYTIQFTNVHLTKCKAELHIDGESIGIFVLSPFDNTKLETKPGTGKKFKFVKLTEENEGKLLRKNENLGLITVKFTPELEIISSPQMMGGGQSLSTKSASRSIEGASAGGTVLSGNSSQKFNTVNDFPVDDTKQTIINLRLICINKEKVEDIPIWSTNGVPPSLI
jgi:hypothetical protein